jgi:hypothetical protein
MLPLAIALVLVTAYAVAVTAYAAALSGQQRMMDKMAVDAKRQMRRETRRSTTYLDALMQRTGVQLYRRTHTNPDERPRPSRTIYAPSQLIERQRQEDSGVSSKPPIEQVPPAIAEQFLKDAANGNGAA